MKLLITGGAGFVGANLAVYLAERGHEVTALDNLSRKGSKLNLPRLEAAGVYFHEKDVVEGPFWGLPRHDAIIHGAAQTSAVPGLYAPSTDFYLNVRGSFVAIEACRLWQAGLIYFSTNKVYPATRVNRENRSEDLHRWEWIYNPFYPLPGFMHTHGVSEGYSTDGNDHSLYGATKLAGELLAREMSSAFDFPCIANRCSCLAGPWQWGCAEQGWVAWWIIAWRFRWPLQYFGWKGKQVRDVLFIFDLCRLIEKQIDRIGEFRGEVFNVGGGPENTLSPRELSQWCFERLAPWGPELVETIEDPRRADHCIYISDIRKVCQAFDWQPEFGIDDGLAEIAEWVKSHAETLRQLYGG